MFHVKHREWGPEKHEISRTTLWIKKSASEISDMPIATFGQSKAVRGQFS